MSAGTERFFDISWAEPSYFRIVNAQTLGTLGGGPRERRAVGVGIMAMRAGCTCRERVADAYGVLHDRGERRLERIHFRLRPDGDPQMRRPDRPDAADKHLLRRHRFDHLFCGMLGLQHEKVGL